MKEGTKSYLIGCHQFLLHPLWVLLAWRLEYKKWPRWWEIICIFLHDVGICGRQYLSDDNAKKGHWRKGAEWSRYVMYRFTRNRSPWIENGRARWHNAFDFCGGHCPEESNYTVSKLSRADKRSWLVAPMWWLWWNYWVEWNSKGLKVTPPPIWKKLVAENLRRVRPLESHELYIRNRGKK